MCTKEKKKEKNSSNQKHKFPPKMEYNIYLDQDHSILSNLSSSKNSQLQNNHATHIVNGIVKFYPAHPKFNLHAFIYACSSTYI